jgi:hypothetical protein
VTEDELLAKVKKAFGELCDRFYLSIQRKGTCLIYAQTAVIDGLPGVLVAVALRDTEKNDRKIISARIANAVKALKEHIAIHRAEMAG